MQRALIFLVFFTACSSGENTLNTPKTYFDVRGYFEKEAARLKKQKPIVEKTVSQNSEFEKKEMQITDWKTELALFSESDINKPAWKNSYRIEKNGYHVNYNAIDNKLRTQKITLSLSQKGTIKKIEIYNKTANALYNSTEELHYFPDSGYQIIKHQNVKVIGKNSYTVSSRFKTKIK